MPIWNPLCLTLLWTSWLTPGGHWGGDLISVFFSFGSAQQTKTKNTNKHTSNQHNHKTKTSWPVTKYVSNSGFCFCVFFFDGSCCMSRAINSMYAERPNLKSVSVYSPNKNVHINGRPFIDGRC